MHFGVAVEPELHAQILVKLRWLQRHSPITQPARMPYSTVAAAELSSYHQTSLEDEQLQRYFCSLEHLPWQLNHLGSASASLPKAGDSEQTARLPRFLAKPVTDD